MSRTSIRSISALAQIIVGLGDTEPRFIGKNTHFYNVQISIQIGLERQGAEKCPER